MRCLDAFHDASGGAGEHKIPLDGYDTPMTKALAEVEKNRPDEDFSIRKIADVFPIK